MKQIQNYWIDLYKYIVSDVNIAWWVFIILAILTWAAGAAICWIQHGWVDNITWYGIHCHK